MALPLGSAGVRAAPSRLAAAARRAPGAAALARAHPTGPTRHDTPHAAGGRAHAAPCSLTHGPGRHARGRASQDTRHRGLTAVTSEQRQHSTTHDNNFFYLPQQFDARPFSIMKTNAAHGRGTPYCQDTRHLPLVPAGCRARCGARAVRPRLFGSGLLAGPTRRATHNSTSLCCYVHVYNGSVQRHGRSAPSTPARAGMLSRPSLPLSFSLSLSLCLRRSPLARLALTSSAAAGATN